MYVCSYVFVRNDFELVLVSFGASKWMVFYKRLLPADTCWWNKIQVRNTGKLIGIICECIYTMCNVVEQWCEETGLFVNPVKTGLKLLTLHKRKFQVTYYLPKTLNSKKGRQVYASDAWWLTNHQITSRINNKKGINNNLAAAQSWGKKVGVKTPIPPLVYTAVERPKITFEAVLWWPAAERLSIAMKLTGLQKYQRRRPQHPVRTAESPDMDEK